MNGARLEPDGDQLRRFVEAVFRYAEPGAFTSLRAFFDDGRKDPFRVKSVEVGDDHAGLVYEASRMAFDCANHPDKITFAPIVCTFGSREARAVEGAIANGLVLFVECDRAPGAARKRLTGLLGPPTLVVESGGTWFDRETGEYQPKLHLYWRLTEPTRDPEAHVRLKRAMRLALALVGADASMTVVHPIRCPGSWHRKDKPRLCTIVAEAATEIDLSATLDILEGAVMAEIETAEQWRDYSARKKNEIGRQAHDERVMQLRRALDGTAAADPAPANDTLRAADAIDLGTALAVIPNNDADWETWNRVGMATWAASNGAAFGYAAWAAWSAKSAKDVPPRTRERWDHYATSPPSKIGMGSLVHLAKQAVPTFVQPSAHRDRILGAARWERGQTARKDVGVRPDAGDPGRAAPAPREAPDDADGYAETVEPVDLWGHFEPPVLPRGLLPDVIEHFARVQGEMMGADPAGLAMAALAVCAAALPDKVRIRVKVHDPSWHESARIWVALVGEPSTKKTPIMSQADRPLKKIDKRLYDEWSWKQAAYDALDKDKKKITGPPKQIRKRLEDTTIEAAQIVLQSSHDGVLCFQDELSGWFGSMEKYGGAGKGSAKDRSFWLQSFNGGTFAVNRVQRGSGMVENLSVCLLGGIQPDPIRRVAADAVDDGLIQRLFPIILKPSAVGKDEPIQFDPIGTYHDAVNGLFRMRPPVPPGVSNLRDIPDVDDSTLRFDEDAQAIRRDLEKKHHRLSKAEAINGKLAAHVIKYDGLFARLCVLFHCLDHWSRERPPPTIGKDLATRVAQFLHRFLLPHALAFYGSILGLSDDHGRLSNVASYILTHKLKSVKYRDVQRGDGSMRNLTKADTTRVLEQLEALGWLEQEPQPPRANASPGWLVNPEVHRRFTDRAETEARKQREARSAVAEVLNATR